MVKDGYTAHIHGERERERKDLQKELTESFSHVNRLFFVGITPMLYLKFHELHQTTHE
jgi:hypothetical protein